MIATAATRDSLHLLVGIPESWAVEGASMALVNNMSSTELMALQENLIDEQAVAALLQQFKSTATTLAPDAGVSAALTGDTILAHDNESGEIPVTLNSAKLWKGFSAPVNIVLPAGSKPDTVLAMDSVLALASAAGVMDSATAALMESYKTNPMMPKKVGVTMIPVLMFLKVKAASVEKDDTLYYFSKTGTMTPGASPIASLLSDPQAVKDLNALESGDMVFVPVKVSSSVATVRKGAPLSTGTALSAVVNRKEGTVAFTLGSTSPQNAALSIYSLQGALVSTVTPREGTALWNGTDERGVRMPVGSYVAKTGVHTVGFQLLR